MANVHTVTLEFLRKGPPHNQLLSPLTDYLGICGDHAAASVIVPYKHGEFLSKLKELLYQGSGSEDSSGRQEAIQEMGVKIAELLATVEGLKTELSKASVEKGAFVNLNVVLSASELAMLPFELSKVPAGCPGSGAIWLSRMDSPRVCITRQIRSVSGEGIQWPRTPKVLFVAADPGGRSVPREEHTQALLSAVKPWIKYFDPKDTDARTKAVSQILTILPNATIEEIQEVCSLNTYTHVHILAHGGEARSVQGSPFGVLLHSNARKQESQVVTGSHFAAALGRKSIPTVVTVASCDSGHVNDLVYSTGASFAHELHQAGVPFVVASQFPLTYRGSIHVVKDLYPKLLWGEDPRIALHELRGKLFALHVSDSHDWASLVAYAALPDDLEEQLLEVQYNQANLAIGAALDRIGETIKNMTDGSKMKLDSVLRSFSDEVNVAIQKMPIDRGYETEGNGMRGSAEKRTAEVMFRASCRTQDDPKDLYLKRSFESLQKALGYYERAFNETMRETRGIVRRKRSLHWVLCQYLSLRAVLGKDFPRDLWDIARVSAEIDLKEDGIIRVWANGTLGELYFLLLAYDEKKVPLSHQEAKKKAEEHIGQVILLDNTPDHFPINSTGWQFQRYINWWCDPRFEAELNKTGAIREVDWSQKGGLKDLAAELVKLLSKGSASV